MSCHVNEIDPILLQVLFHSGFYFLSTSFHEIMDMCRGGTLSENVRATQVSEVAHNFPRLSLQLDEQCL